MASLASPKSFQASLSMPKEIMSPFQNLTKAIILSRKINSFAYFVEDNQSTDENDINLLLCVQSVVKLEEEFEDTPNHGSYNYIEAAIEITKSDSLAILLSEALTKLKVLLLLFLAYFSAAKVSAVSPD